jgi:hypothetical protein
VHRQVAAVAALDFLRQSDFVPWLTQSTNSRALLSGCGALLRRAGDGEPGAATTAATILGMAAVQLGAEAAAGPFGELAQPLLLQAARTTAAAEATRAAALALDVKVILTPPCILH